LDTVKINKKGNTERRSVFHPRRATNKKNEYIIAVVFLWSRVTLVRNEAIAFADEYDSQHQQQLDDMSE
jgi:hypothetical protein